MESDPKLAGFNLIQASYKQVRNHAIRAIRADLLDDLLSSVFTAAGCNILTTKITGDSIYLDWFPQWLLDLAQGGHGFDGMARLEDWLQESLQGVVEEWLE
ncbi:hypothetical protein PHISP_07182 [Aspergillus sp. HF37]|nr:hypothetical protein PHISP_07182 [Aspergillus sp. HF37]